MRPLAPGQVVFLTCALAGALLPGLARADVNFTVTLWPETSGEATYLQGWLWETFNDTTPRGWWESGNACQEGNNPGMSPGISCKASDPANPGVLHVDEVNLGPTGYSGPGNASQVGQLKVPPYLVGLKFLSKIDISNNNVKGPLPGSITLAPRLTGLVVANNRLTGTLSSQLCNLTCLNVRNNSMSGAIPDCFKKFPCMDLALNNFTNPGNCDSTANVSSCDRVLTTSTVPDQGSGGLSVGAIVGIVLGALAFVVLLVTGIVFFVLWRRRVEDRKAQQKLREQIEEELSRSSFGPLKRFGLEEIAAACDNFADDNCVGMGGFSVVYKGTLEGGTDVAIKKMKERKGSDGTPFELQFLHEVEVISRASHRHLLACHGFALQAGEAACLVLQYCSNGSVASRTQGKQGAPLSGPMRLRIARGAAAGLAYLHNDCEPPIMHGDIKPENVLLDGSDEAVLADFGLAQEIPSSTSADSAAFVQDTNLKGTLGHLAPEYFISGKRSFKTDVYAFGVFLLELVSGKNVFSITENTAAMEIGLHPWVEECVATGNITQLVDSELSEDTELSAEEGSPLLQLLKVAVACVAPDPETRPDMEEVGKMLAEDAAKLATQWAAHLPEELSDAQEVLKDLANPASWEEVTTGVVLQPLEQAKKQILAGRKV